MRGSVAAAPRPRGPELNLSDIPELMPGAEPSANHAKRFEFEERCRALHREEVRDGEEAADLPASPTGKVAAIAELCACFPALDAALVRELVLEAPTVKQAVDTLLAIANVDRQGDDGGADDDRDLGVEDLGFFPSLSAKENLRAGEPPLCEGGPGSNWCDRAKAVAAQPAPAASRPPRGAPSWSSRRRAGAKEEQEQEEEEPQQPLTDYELRHHAAARRFAATARRQAALRASRAPLAGAAAIGGATDLQSLASESSDGE